MIVLEIAAIVILGVVYFAVYLPLLSQPYPGDISDVVHMVTNIQMLELENLVSHEMSDRIAKSAAWERRKLTRWRPRAIGERLLPAEANVRLGLAFTRWEARKIRKKLPGPRSEQDRLLEELYQQAQLCSLALMFAKFGRVLAFWDTERLIRFHREVVLEELRNFLLLFLKVAGTYGGNHRENMLAWLDVWELYEEYR